MNFQSSQKEKERGFGSFTEKTLERKGAKQSGPWPEIEAGWRGKAGRFWRRWLPAARGKWPGRISGPWRTYWCA